MALDFDLEQTGPELQAILNQVGVNTEDIAEEAQTRQEDDETLQTNIDTGDDDLQQQINQIVSGGTTVNLTASPSTVFVGVPTVVDLTATSSTPASAISISGGNMDNPETGSGSSLSADDIINAAEPGTTTYNAVFTISGIEKSKSVSVAAVLPIYYGAGNDLADVSFTQMQTPRTSPAGATFQQTTTAGQHIFVKIPHTMTLNALYLVGAFDTQLGITQVAEADGYIIYKNNEARGAGTYTYKLA